ncbi:MAG: trehalose-phosphatase [Geminicoccaceae bacterium]
MTDNLNAPPTFPLSDAALFFDVDGTLVAIERQPDAVKVSDHLRDLLQRLATGTNGAFALVSGRSIDQLDHLFAPLAFSASGLHGLEKRLLPGEITRAGPMQQGMTKQGIEGARRELERFADRHEGVFVEDKGLTLALHYRMAAEHREAAAALVRKLVEADPDHLVLLEGKMVFELKPPGFDKGRAIADFMQQPPFRGRQPIFAGDDVTDEAGFAVINALKGVTVKVGADDRPTEASFGLSGVEATLEWLDALADSETSADGKIGGSGGGS